MVAVCVCVYVWIAATLLLNVLCASSIDTVFLLHWCVGPVWMHKYLIFFYPSIDPSVFSAQYCGIDERDGEWRMGFKPFYKNRIAMYLFFCMQRTHCECMQNRISLHLFFSVLLRRRRHINGKKGRKEFCKWTDLSKWVYYIGVFFIRLTEIVGKSNRWKCIQIRRSMCELQLLIFSTIIRRSFSASNSVCSEIFC